MKHTLGDTPEEEPERDGESTAEVSAVWPNLNRLEWPSGPVTVPVPEKAYTVVPKLYGLQPLKDMSREDMVAEILQHQRGHLEAMDTSVLRENIVHMRVADYANRLNKEASEAEGS